ncbi:MAG TPA: hypothetical protein PLD47_03680, partial [Aggregatilineales bacterium]|nr:hypothetical protein [Aggregatilineales bacterium]
RPSIWGAVDSLAQESYTRRAYERAANEWAWAGGLILAYWQPAAPADDPIQGFAVREKARAWFADGAFFDTAGALPPGLYPPDDPRLAYSGRWRFGALGADLQIAPDESPPADGSGHTIRFRFRGGSLGFLVRRGDFTAYLYPRVDGQPGNTLPRIPEGNPVGGGEAYILLKSPTRDPLTEMIQAARLPHGDHEAAVGAWLGYDQWILAGVGVGSPPPSEDGRLTLGVLVALIGGIGAAFSTWRARRILRAAAEPVLHYSGRMGGVLGGIGVSLAAAVGMALTLNNALPELLRRDIPALFLTGIVVGGLSFSPILPLTGVALIALWVLIYNRPLIGLALIVFWMPFFLAPIDLHVYALPMVELATLITASVVAVRAFFGWMLRSAADPFRRYAPPAHQRTPLRWAFMDTALIAFVILGALSLTWSAQINPASRELRIMILQPILFYALLRLYRPTVEDAVRLVDVLILAG